MRGVTSTADAVEAELANAVRLRNLGQAAAAEAACRRAMKMAPRLARPQLMLGDLAVERGETDRAIKIIRRAVALDPGNGIAHFTLGRAFHHAENPAAAKASYRRAIELRPDLAVAHANLAIVLFDLGEHEAAWASGLKAIELDPRLAEAHMTIGRALRELQHLAPAEAALRQAIKLDARLPEAHNTLGRVLHQLGRSEEALGCHREALRLDANLAAGWSGLGQAQRALGRFDEAATSFRRALEIAPDFGEALRDLAMSEKAAADEAELADMAAVLAKPELPPGERAAAGFGLGKWLDDMGRHDEAFARYAEANALSRQAAIEQGASFDADALRQRVDGLIATFSPEFFAARAAWGVTSELPVYVVGHFRSGTTLTEQILASHPQVYGAGELADIPDMASGIAQAGGDALAWKEDRIRQLAEQELSRLDKRGNGAHRVVDKLPENIFHLGLIATLFPRARVICCHRDARDNVLSCFFQRFSNAMLFTTDLAECGIRHLETERLAAHWRRALPIPLLDLDYEALVGDLEGQARRLIAFLGLDWDPACLAFHETERAVNTPSTWQVRQPIYASSVGRWRHYEKHLGPLLRLLEKAGYRD